MANATPRLYLRQVDPTAALRRARWLVPLLTIVLMLKLAVVFQLKDLPLLHPEAGLDTTAYVLARKDQDCERCRECGIGSQRCVRACTPAAAPDTNVPGTCRPLRHDGEVCLRALAAASCDDYAGYVADFAPATPTECQFCKEVPQGGVPALVFDAGGPADGGTP